jgi:SpoVK/Ycf46/Vps4 family AAA+-type ATPase
LSFAGLWAAPWLPRAWGRGLSLGGNLATEETTGLLRTEDELHKRIIGQQEAVERAEGPKRPSGSFIFAGPSGVGKTELSKALANFLFGENSTHSGSIRDAGSRGRPLQAIIMTSVGP